MVKEKSKYYTNKAIRTKIDRLLELNARNVSNESTGSKNDLGSKELVQEAWMEIQNKIKELDPMFYEIIKSR
tara:strand:- start:1677 stop:1892 length:216 start_codon:yes stop_codon:yes gene_type:complete